MMLTNDLKILPGFYRDYDSEFGKAGNKPGDTIFVRKPVRFLGRDGQAYAPEGMVDTQVPVVINQQSGVDMEFSTADKYLSIDDFATRYLKPAAASLANKLDYRCGVAAMQNTANLVGVPGTVPGSGSSNAFLTYGQAGALIDKMGFTQADTRRMIINSDARISFVDYSKGQFNPAPAISSQWKTGKVSDLLSYDWFVDNNVPVQTIGALGGTPAVNGANQTGSSLIMDGWTASITNVLNVGDNITLAGVYSVNPQSRVSTGTLQDFVIQAAASSDSGGNATLSIFPAMVPTGQYQNVSNSPADNALISVYHTAAAGQGALAALNTPQQLLYTKEAFAFVSFPGDVPDGVDMGYAERDDMTGVACRFVRIFDGRTDQWINRFDVYYGIAPLYPEGACRVAS